MTTLPRTRGISVRANGRFTGAVYLAYFVVAIAAESLAGRTPVAVSDAANILSTVAYVALTLLLYEMFRPVNGAVARVALALSLAGCVAMTLALFGVGPHTGFLLFFGGFDAAIGYLIIASRFVPRAIGVLMIFAGAGWMMVSLFPLPAPASFAMQALGFIAELALMLWLLVRGIDADRRTQLT